MTEMYNTPLTKGLIPILTLISIYVYIGQEQYGQNMTYNELFDGCISYICSFSHMMFLVIGGLV